MELSPVWGNMHHVCVIVRDLDKAIKYYESFGIGPWESSGYEVVSRKYRGQSMPIGGLRAKSAAAPPIRIELIQPVAGTSPWSDFLNRYGEGAMHIAFLVDDIEQARGAMVERGLEIIFESRFRDGGGAIYVSFEKMGGVMLELIQPQKNASPDRK